MDNNLRLLAEFPKWFFFLLTDMTLTYFLPSTVETECPAGTKCVSDHFCDENAIMVFTRVDLTPEQKKRRGDLIVSQ